MNFLKLCVFLVLLTTLTVWLSSPRAETLIPDVPHPYAADLLTQVRAAAKAVPGPLPIHINFIKIARSPTSSWEAHNRITCPHAQHFRWCFPRVGS
jgi:hypothetical protein